MRQRFAETFQAVNAAFGRTFGRLFNGGSMLRRGDDDAGLMLLMAFGEKSGDHGDE